MSEPWTADWRQSAAKPWRMGADAQASSQEGEAGNPFRIASPGLACAAPGDMLSPHGQGPQQTSSDAMTRITNVDQIVAILRQRLLEKDRSSGASRAVVSVKSGQQSALQALAGIEGVDDRRLRRAVIQDILADQFGRHLVNDASFQQMVDRVTSTLENDPGAANVFATVIRDLRAQAQA